MKLSSKHQNPQQILYTDFSGGLDSAMMDGDIAPNELRESMNVEVDSQTRLLRTCKGTVDLCQLSSPIHAAAYDVLNHVFLTFTDDYKVMETADFKKFTDLGDVSGSSNIITAQWEDGLLIASGGRLQYYNGEKLVTLENSPQYSRGAYIRSGRVLTFDDEDNVLYSAVGDENNWTTDANDPSKALFAQIGYKAGGRLIGMVNMSKDILFIKDNGMVFRLENEYPDWRISELGRNIYCRNGLSFCNIGEQVVILGSGILQSITTTQDYGDMKPANIGKKVKRELTSLGMKVKLRYVPCLNQIWFIDGSKNVLVMDTETGAFFQRTFNKPVVDIIGVDEDVYLFRPNAVSKFTEAFMDDEKPLTFLAKFKTSYSLNEFLVKKVNMGITPYLSRYDDAQSYIKVGHVKLPFPRRDLSGKKITTGLYTPARIEPSTLPVDNYKGVYNDTEFVTPTDMVQLRVRCINRSPMVRMEIYGSGFPFTLNFIGYDWVEV